ncbi:hypothetical protein [Pseudomonas sp. MF6754]|uniref:hypothetical protein n=1 Tax=Pseudomonas sp. MF6754 TaxID=2797529 RepID=UPI0019095173|nr:hypothetical protein [Pseudomonas sp. MF6754]MBK3453239.1 hypothetical protein [Pseudomonas sp. MF6754]
MQKRILALTCLVANLVGCNTFTPPAQMKAVKEDGVYWMSYNSDRRGAMVVRGDAKMKVCAEPAPDTASNFESEVKVVKKEIGEASGNAGQSVVILPGRNSTVLTLREALYRLCELSVNRNDVPAVRIMDAYDQVISAVTQYAKTEAAIETAKAAQAGVTLPATPIANPVTVAKDYERSGFQNIIDGNFINAEKDFSRAEELYPKLHNVYEIRNALSSALKDGSVSENEKNKLLKNISDEWSWGAPPDLLEKIKSQIK